MTIQAAEENERGGAIEEQAAGQRFDMVEKSREVDEVSVNVGGGSMGGVRLSKSIAGRPHGAPRKTANHPA